MEVCRKRTLHWLAVAALVVAAGCSPNEVRELFDKPDLEPLAGTINTTIPLGYAASLAMAYANGDSAANVSAIGNCDSFPCNALLSITIDENYPIPTTAGPNDYLLVGAAWPSADQAVMTVVFTHFDLRAGSIVVSSISTVLPTQSVTAVWGAAADNLPKPGRGSQPMSAGCCP